MSHPNPVHDRENERTEDHHRAPVSTKGKALEIAKVKKWKKSGMSKHFDSKIAPLLKKMKNPDIGTPKINKNNEFLK